MFSLFGHIIEDQNKHNNTLAIIYKYLHVLAVRFYHNMYAFILQLSLKFLCKHSKMRVRFDFVEVLNM